MKLYKKINPNFRKMLLLFLLQVILGMMPMLIFLAFVFCFSPDNLQIAVIFISLMLFSFAGYLILSQKYNILLSGMKGERSLKQIAKSAGEGYTAFANIPIRYKRNSSEVDLLLVSEKGVLLVEVKNHSGIIIGSEHDENWTQKKLYSNKKSVESEMPNPFRQIRRQREIVKSILRAKGLDVWIDNVLYFSNPKAKLHIEASGNNYVCGNRAELERFIRKYKSGKPLEKEQVDAIIETFKEML